MRENISYTVIGKGRNACTVISYIAASLLLLFPGIATAQARSATSQAVPYSLPVCDACSIRSLEYAHQLSDEY